MNSAQHRQDWRRFLHWNNSYVTAAGIASFVVWVHWLSGVPQFRSFISTEPGWEQFKATYNVKSFGEDGYFVRAMQNGYNVFHFTPQYAWRFTRKTGLDQKNACSSCHTPEALAYGFVNSDRFDILLGRKISFEERIMRCFAGPMDGFIPTLYDPTIRDLRIFARAVAHHLQLSEGALKSEKRPSAH